MTVNTVTGSRLFIGPVRASTVDTLSEYRALAWTLIGEIESMGDTGDQSNAVTFQSIGDSRIRKLKGARDAGSATYVLGRDVLDAGQIALKAAERTKFEYAFKVEYADAPSDDYDNSIEYFGALVMGARTNMGGGDNVVKVTAELGINTEITEDPASLTTG